MATQRIKRLRAIGQICLQGVHIWIIKRRLVDVEDLMAVAQQLLNHTAAHHARAAGDHYALFGTVRWSGGHGYGFDLRRGGSRGDMGRFNAAATILVSLYEGAIPRELCWFPRIAWSLGLRVGLSAIGEDR